MTMSYNGALVMPSSYAVMDTEEMTYVEGGGTFRIKINEKAVRNLALVGGNAAFGVVNAAMGATGVGAVISLAVTSLVYTIMLDCICDIRPVDVSVSAWYLPNYTFEWNM